MLDAHTPIPHVLSSFAIAFKAAAVIDLEASELTKALLSARTAIPGGKALRRKALFVFLPLLVAVDRERDDVDVDLVVCRCSSPFDCRSKSATINEMNMSFAIPA